MLRGFGLRFMLEAMNPRSNIYRALSVNPGTAIYEDEQCIYARDLEVPSGGGFGTARAIAHTYSVFATGGRNLGLRQQMLDLLAAPAIAPTRVFYDECLKTSGVRFSLGFMKPSAVWRFGCAAQGDAIIRQGRRRRVHLVAMPPEQRAPILREYVRIASSGRQHFPLRVGAPLPDFEAIAGRYPVYRIDLS